MIIYPAIDIKDGKVVRLLQGRFSDVTEYSDDPVNVAQKWAKDGAQWIHVVDLDGAKKGQVSNFEAIAQIARSVRVPVQVGGGIRSDDDISRFLDVGISRVVLGTKVFEDQDFLQGIIGRWPHQIAVSLDCSDGMVVQKGWTEPTDIKGVELAKELEGIGVQCIIYTDIKRDGMLTGPNFGSIEEILDAVNIQVIASGGISNIDDIKRLLTLKSKGLGGAITGKAIYEGVLDLKEAIHLCSTEE